MQLTDTQIKEFQKIHQKQTGETLSMIEAREAGMQLINLMSFVYKPIKKVDYAKIIKNNNY